MKDSLSQLTEAQIRASKYCDRCARRSVVLFYDDLTLQELCQECGDRLNRKCALVSNPAKPKM
jgi:hypothetical protein